MVPMVPTGAAAPRHELFAHSGKNGLAWALPIAGLVSAAASALVYAWVTVHNPLVGYLSVLLVVGFAFAAVLPLMYTGLVLHVRNPLTMRMYGTVTGIATVYLSWVFFAWLLLRGTEPGAGSTVLSWASSPAGVWAFANGLAEVGWFTLSGGLTPTGIVLWIAWIVEAAIVIGVCTRFAPCKVKAHGYCESCRRWMKREKPLRVSADEDATPRDIARAGLARLQRVVPPSPDAMRWLRIERQRCARCRTAGVYRVDHVMRVGFRFVFLPRDLFKTSQAETVVPLAWQRDPERAELERIAGALTLR